MARPPKDPALIAKALKLVEQGASPVEAAAACGLGKSTLYEAMKQRRADAAPKPALAAAKKAGRTRSQAGKRAAQEEPPAPEPSVVIPPELKGVELDLWIIDREVKATLDALEKARMPGSPLFARTASLQDQLRRLMQTRRELRPDNGPTPEDEERRWQADAAAVRGMIEAGVREAEQQAAAVRKDG